MTFLHSFIAYQSSLQILHCLEHKGCGGETVLVDGFRAAYNLKNSNEDSFNRLCSTMIESEYIEERKHYVSLGPILKLNPLSKQLQQIRFVKIMFFNFSVLILHDINL